MTTFLMFLSLKYPKDEMVTMPSFFIAVPCNCNMVIGFLDKLRTAVQMNRRPAIGYDWSNSRVYFPMARNRKVMI